MNMNSVLEELKQWQAELFKKTKKEYAIYSFKAFSDYYPCDLRSDEIVREVEKDNPKAMAELNKQVLSIKADLRSCLEEEFRLHESGLCQKTLDKMWQKAHDRFPLFAESINIMSSMERLVGIYRHQYQMIVETFKEFSILL